MTAIGIYGSEGRMGRALRELRAPPHVPLRERFTAHLLERIVDALRTAERNEKLGERIGWLYS